MTEEEVKMQDDTPVEEQPAVSDNVSNAVSDNADNTETTEGQEETEEISEEQDEKMPFPTARVVRIIRANVAKDKMIKSDVKIGMNKFLGNIAVDVAKKLDKYPYSMINYQMFQEATEQYTTLDKVAHEKRRILAHLEAIKEDCNKLIRDVNETFKTEDEE